MPIDNVIQTWYVCLPEFLPICKVNREIGLMPNICVVYQGCKKSGDIII